MPRGWTTCLGAGLALLAGPALAGEPRLSAVKVKGDAAFQARAREAIAGLRRTETGKRLFDELERAEGTVTLRFGTQEFAGAVMYATGDGDSVVLWDPDYSLESFPSMVFLYHELVHALHEAKGERRRQKKAEEARAIGLGAFRDYALAENALRRELGLPARAGSGSREDWIKELHRGAADHAPNP